MWAEALLCGCLAHDDNVHMAVVSLADLQGRRRHEFILAGDDEEVEVAGQVKVLRAPNMCVALDMGFSVPGVM